MVWEINYTMIQSTIESFSSLGNRRLNDSIELTTSFRHEWCCRAICDNIDW